MALALQHSSSVGRSLTTVPAKNSISTHGAPVTSNPQMLLSQSSTLQLTSDSSTPSSGNRVTQSERGGENSKSRGDRDNDTTSSNSSSPHSSPKQTLSEQSTSQTVSNPCNLNIYNPTALTTSPMTSSSSAAALGLNLSALRAASPFTVAMPNPLLTGLSGTPGISTPSGIAGLVSPILLGNNPFLTVLGSSSGLSKTAITAASQPGAGAAAVYTQVQPGASAHLQLITQLQDRISAQLRTSPAQRDIGSLLANIGTTSQVVAAASGFGQDLNNRERQLESLLMSKTPVYCIASPPEVLVSQDEVLSMEHVIKYIDTLSPSLTDSMSNGGKKKGGHCSPDKEVIASSCNSTVSNASCEELEKTTNTSRKKRVGKSSGLLESMLSKSETKPSTSPTKDASSTKHPKKTTSQPPHPTSHHSPTKAMTTSPLVVTSAVSGITPAPSILSTNSVAAPAAALPLLYAAQPTTVAAALTPLASPPLASPIKGYYVVLNPSLAAVGQATAAVQPLMIATNSNSNTVPGSLQKTVLASAAAATPLLATTLSSVLPPMFYHGVPNSSYNLSASATVSSATTVGGEDNEGRSSSSIQATEVKKRLRNDHTESQFMPETKRIRTDANKAQVTSAKTVEMQVSTEREGAMGQLQTATEDSTTASESEDERADHDKAAVHSEGMNKPSSRKFVRVYCNYYHTLYTRR